MQDKKIYLRGGRQSVGASGLPPFPFEPDIRRAVRDRRSAQRCALLGKADDLGTVVEGAGHDAGHRCGAIGKIVEEIIAAGPGRARPQAINKSVRMKIEIR